MTNLTFDEFRRANLARCLKWHPEGIESWSPSDWLTAVTGELGELASLLKMRNRERDALPGNKFSPTQKQIADECADVFTYLDLLATSMGIDLGEAAVSKFNEISARVGFPDRIVAPVSEMALTDGDLATQRAIHDRAVPSSTAAKEDPRRHDIGFDDWMSVQPYFLKFEPKGCDAEIFYTAEQMREAWIAGHTSTLSATAAKEYPGE